MIESKNTIYVASVFFLFLSAIKVTGTYREHIDETCAAVYDQLEAQQQQKLVERASPESAGKFTADHIRGDEIRINKRRSTCMKLISKRS